MEFKSSSDVTEPAFAPSSSIDISSVYNHRFASINQKTRDAVWAVITAYIRERYFSGARRILDPAAGRGEFLRNITAEEKWGVDLVDQVGNWSDFRVRFIKGDVMEKSLPHAYFDGVFVSNFLEHLSSPEEIQHFLSNVHSLMKPGGKLVILGPNFAYCYKEYFDFMDHKIALTEKSVVEHLVAARFRVQSVHAQFLPYSFTSALPVHPILVWIYLRIPLAWRIFGKQFILSAVKSDD